MLIYDGFKTIRDAEAFGKAVTTLGENRDVVVTGDRLDDLDPFPYELHDFIVYVGRLESLDVTSEAQIEALAVLAGGRFAGT